jgi:hypothetical protein
VRIQRLPRVRIVDENQRISVGCCGEARTWLRAMDVIGDTAGVQMDSRRVARNQATLRTLNEGIDTEPADGVIAFRCECGQLGCNQLLPLRRAQYEAVRLNARRFVIAPGHVVAELEHEVERHAEYAVVETHPHTSDFAERTDPRTADTD